MPAKVGWAYHNPDGDPCSKCGLPRKRHRVRHPPGCQCGASHKGGRSPSDRRTRKHRRYIVAIDGEGIGRKPHKYTLLARSDSSGKSAHITDQRGLSTERCLEWLLELPNDALGVGYFLGYDWTMILRELPDSSLFRLFRPELRKLPKDEGSGFSDVLWKGYRLHWMAGMMRIKRGNRKVHIWDLGKFFQARFVKALKAWKVGTPEEIDAIDDMKDKRSDFDATDSKQILGYCLSECRLLAQLAEKLIEAHNAADLSLSTFYGPGSTATVALKRMGIHEKRGEHPTEIHDVAARAFFGGRFEQRAIGEFDGPIYGADIVSAYPAQCVKLPCLEHSTWEWTEIEYDLERSSVKQACVRWTVNDTSANRKWGPLPVRMRDGTIVYPASGASGWTWLDEYLEARHWPQVQFGGAWLLKTDCTCTPFADVQRMFDERNRVGRKTGAGLTLKLAINSIYGKLAQSIGQPRFRSLLWAGMITSGTRAMLLNVLRRYDGDILAVATDGVYSTSKPELDYGESLGQWEASEYDRITLVRPGIYWTEPDELDDGNVRSRGLPRTRIHSDREQIVQAIILGEDEVILPSITQFGAARAAIYHTPKGQILRSDKYGEWYQRPARISFKPAPKRTEDWDLWKLPDVESIPYNPKRMSVEALALRIASKLYVGD